MSISPPPHKLRKPSSVRHTRAIARDRSKRPVVGPPDTQVTARLTDLIHPLTFAQAAHDHALGLRERTLTLPVMVALVLSMIWRQIGSVCTLTRKRQVSDRTGATGGGGLGESSGRDG